MSIAFSESTNYTGICELIDDLVGTNTTSYSLAKKARDVNTALDKVWSIIFNSGGGGTWQFDDITHTKYPIITTNLVSGQRDYSFTTDEQSNYILDIYKVMVKNSSTGIYVELDPVDQQGESANSTMNDGQNLTGIPTQYDKTANGIFLDLIPSYSATNGLKIWINREPLYFTSSDTTKKAGFAGIFHEYLALRPAYNYAQRHGLDNADKLKREMLEMELAIEKYYGNRIRDEKRILTPFSEDNK